MRFVQDLVYHGMVKVLMDPIKAQVSEADEGQLHNISESKSGPRTADRTVFRSRELRGGRAVG